MAGDVLMRAVAPIALRSASPASPASPAALLVALFTALLLAPVSARGADRVGELEGLREKIEKSRERVSEHEASERAILEQLEEVDQRLSDVTRERDKARREVGHARAELDALRPQIERAERDLAPAVERDGPGRERAAGAGEIGAVRVLFASSSLREWMARARALRTLVRHDAVLVERVAAERDRLAQARQASKQAVDRREQANIRLTALVADLDAERRSKNAILARARRDRTAERRLLVELEQAARALEETIKSLGRASDAGSGSVPGAAGGLRRGALVAPVDAPIALRFGRVVDPEFQTETFRSGVDFEAPAGSAVVSVGRGIVRFAGWFRGYGRIVIIDHGDAYHTVSGHLDEILVKLDDTVLPGQAIGTVGETGSLAGPGLYFELRRAGSPIDPVPWFSGD
jgi:murein hydrolase activator